MEVSLFWKMLRHHSVTQRRHAHSKWWFFQIFEPSGFWMQLPKDKKQPNNIFYIWYNHTSVIKSFSASYHQLLNSNLRSLAGAEPETDAFVQRCIMANHTRCCWAYECNDQSDVFRWVIAKMQVFSSLTCWLNTSFWRILSLNNKVQMCVWICK